MIPKRHYPNGPVTGRRVERTIKVIKNVPSSHRINANERGTRKRALDKCMRALESKIVLGVVRSIAIGGQIRDTADAARARRRLERALPNEMAGYDAQIAGSPLRLSGTGTEQMNTGLRLRTAR